MIGLYDSGLGGLSTVSLLLAASIRQSILFVGDTAEFPYGSKTARRITERAGAITHYLAARQVAHSVPACNTIASVIKPKTNDIVSLTAKSARGSNVVVWATPRTVQSGRYQELLPDAKIVAMPKLADSVESGSLTLPQWDGEKCQTLVLACSHYSWLQERLAREFPIKRIIDSSQSLAQGLLYYARNLEPERPNLTCVFTSRSQPERLVAEKLNAKIIIERRI